MVEQNNYGPSIGAREPLGNASTSNQVWRESELPRQLGELEVGEGRDLNTLNDTGNVALRANVDHFGSLRRVTGALAGAERLEDAVHVFPRQAHGFRTPILPPMLRNVRGTKSSRYGLKNMRMPAEVVGARLTIVSAPSQATEFLVIRAEVARGADADRG